MLGETDRLFTCGFCRVKLFISSGDYFRYYIPPAEPVPEDLIFVPYWRFKGFSFTYGDKGTRHRLIDSTALAAEHRTFPISLGIRPQVVQLRFVTPDIRKNFFLPQKNFAEVFTVIERGIDFAESLSLAHETAPSLRKKSPEHRDFIGETVSMIYLPTYIKKNSFYDALTGKPVAPLPEKGVPELASFHKHQRWRLRFIPSICPKCGFDLEGEKESLVLFCGNCDTAWGGSARGLKKMEVKVVPSNKRNIRLVPFWRIKPRVQGMKLDTYADFIRSTMIPKVIRKEMEEEDFHFWVPAFKLHPRTFLRIAKLMTLSQSMRGFGGSKGRAPVYPVTLNSSDAVDSLRVLIAEITMAKKKVIPALKKAAIMAQKTLLVLVPFEITAHDLIERESRVSLNRNALKYGKNL